MSAPIRVLFIHGLESSPNGSKVRLLREQGFEVIAPDMHMGVLQWSRENSVLRQLPRLGEMQIVMSLLVIGIALSVVTSLSWLALGGLALAILWSLVRHKTIGAAAVARSFRACVAIQRDAVQRALPDVVVGSSWGGAVAAELIITHACTQPTILLAPAVNKVGEWSRRPDRAKTITQLRSASADVPIIVFHDPADTTIPFVDSVELARDSHIDFRPVDAGGHRLMELLTRGELATAIRDVARAN